MGLIPGVLPVSSEDLEGDVVRYTARDPRFLAGPTGQLTGVNYLHDLYLAQNPGNTDVRFEGDPGSGLVRITAPRARADSILRLGLAPGAQAPAVAAQGGAAPAAPTPSALDLAAVDPVLAYGMQPGYGIHAGTRAMGYKNPATGAFRFMPQGAPGGAPRWDQPGADALSPDIWNAQVRYYYGGPDNVPVLYMWSPPPPPSAPEPVFVEGSAEEESGGAAPAPAPPPPEPVVYAGGGEPSGSPAEYSSSFGADGSSGGSGGGDVGFGGAGDAMARGGWVRGGVPGRDSVPKVLMPGEFVVRAPAAQRTGPLLQAINAMPAPRPVGPPMRAMPLGRPAPGGLPPQAMARMPAGRPVRRPGLAGAIR